ncbi:hypothetical protein AAIH01_34135, partial [Pseudomonas aeruginosa]
APVGVGRATQGQGVGLLQLWLLNFTVSITLPGRALDWYRNFGAGAGNIVLVASGWMVLIEK